VDGAGARWIPDTLMTTSDLVARAVLRLLPKAVRGALTRVPPTMAVGRSSAWRAVVREPYTGAWQENAEIRAESVLLNPTVFACVTLIANDWAKLRLRLVAQEAPGVWTETTNSAYSPLLRKPNHYQTALQFWTVWAQSKLTRGNTYALKQRDARGVVAALYVLDPCRVTPLVALDQSVYYQLATDPLSGLPTAESIVVPASEICHDLMNPLFHPLVGLSPLYAAALTATQGLNTLQFSTKFFANGAQPGGVLTAPGAISDDTAQRLKTYWEENFSGDNSGRVAVLGDGLKYEQMTMSAVDAQLIEQLGWSANTIASVYHVPPYLVVPGAPTPPYTGPDALFQQYYSQCLQNLLTAAEQVLDHGLGLDPLTLGVEFDIDDLTWMDVATRTEAASKGIHAGALSPNEARLKYFGLGPVTGGDTPYLQQQNYSLAALAERDADQPFTKPAPPSPPAAPAPDPEAEARDVVNGLIDLAYQTHTREATRG
jgi:HK97 family phage portal protein